MPTNLSQSRLKELLSYDGEIGEFKWLQNRGGSARAGSIAGEVRKDGYRVIVVDRQKFYAHRLAWLYAYGRWPRFLIDHINSDRGDNRLANLREATQSQNFANVPARAHNTSGIKGVSWSKRDKCWRSFIKENGKQRGLGSFPTKEAAFQAYQAAAIRIYGEFWRPE